MISCKTNCGDVSKFVIYKKRSYSIEGVLVFGTKSNESGKELKRGKVRVNSPDC